MWVLIISIVRKFVSSCKYVNTYVVRKPIDIYCMTRKIYILITTILLLSCGQHKDKVDNETAKKGNFSTTISTDTSKLTNIIDIKVFKPTHVKFKYTFIGKSGQDERISVPGPSDNYLQAILYFDTTTFKNLKNKYYKLITFPQTSTNKVLILTGLTMILKMS